MKSTLNPPTVWKGTKDSLYIYLYVLPSKVVLNPTCTSSRAPEWYKMQTVRNCPDDLRIQLTIRMDKPNNLKYCGYCYAVGRNAFKKWRKRYICLIQVNFLTLLCRREILPSWSAYFAKKDELIMHMKKRNESACVCQLHRLATLNSRG